MNKKTLITATAVLLVDQITKIFIDAFLGLNESIKIINSFFSLTYTHNYGAAWNILNNKNTLLIIITCIALVIIYRFMNTFKINKRNVIAFGLLFGGIMGNFLDGLFLGYVRDFLDFNIFNYNYPIFNFADSFIFIGVFLLIYAIIKGEDYGNNSTRKKYKNR